jgi:phage terminase large subunit-like protein
MIEGDSGLLATAHPSCKARYIKGEVVWDNGATATVFTPQAPNAILGDEFDLMWMSELHVWPKSTRIQAYDRIRMCVRVKSARTIWDSNPQRRHPLLRRLLERGELDPERHVVFRGTTYDNLDNLNSDVVEEWTRDYSGTQLGREMLLGEQVDEVDGAIFKQEWIDATRRRLPEQLKRRIISIDPAISTRKSTDPTGIMDMALGTDNQIYAVEDLTGKYSWEEWATIATDRYSKGKCDCVVVERNRGGDACVANLRACCSARGIAVVVVDAKAPTHHSPGTLYVKEVIARTSKVNRGEPVAALYEKGRISMVSTAEFAELEEQLTTYEDEGGAVSPNNYDAFVHGAWELAGFWHDQRDSRSEVASAAKALDMITPNRISPVGIYGNRGGRRI